jgi:hypothetical protein
MVARTTRGSGAMNRATAATGMNEGSSRSHSVFTVTGINSRNQRIHYSDFANTHCNANDLSFPPFFVPLPFFPPIFSLPRSLLPPFLFCFLLYSFPFPSFSLPLTLLRTSLLLFFVPYSFSSSSVNQKDTRSGVIKSGKLVLVDLAGSEMVGSNTHSDRYIRTHMQTDTYTHTHTHSTCIHTHLKTHTL